MSEQDDSAKFGVELVDLVSRPGAEAGKQVDALAAKFKKLEKIANGSSGSLARAARSIAFKGVDSGINKIGKGLAYAAAGAVATSTAFAGFAGKWLVEGVAGMAMFAESTRRGYGMLLHDQAKGNEAFKTAVALAKDLGMDVQNVGGQLQHMLAMQFTVGEATDLIKLSQDLQAIGSTAAQAGRALIAMTQIKAKGKLQAEELVGQLAETGVSTVLVYQALSKQLGKTDAEVKKMLKDGLITAEVGIAAIKSAIMTKVGEKTPGEAAMGFMTATLGGALQRLQALPNQMLLQMAENIGPAQMKKISDIVTRLTKQIAEMDTSGFEKFVVSMLNLLETGAPLVKELLEGFGAEFGKGLDEFKLVLSPASLQRARDIGVAIGKIVRAVLWTMDKIAYLVGWISTKAGGWTAVAAGMIVVLWKAVTAFVKIRDVIRSLRTAKDLLQPLTQGAAKGLIEQAVKRSASGPLPGVAGSAAQGAAGGAGGAAAGWLARSRAALMRGMQSMWTAVTTFAKAGWARVGLIVTTATTAIQAASWLALGVFGIMAGSLVFLGYTIYKHWDALLDSFDWLFDNIGTGLIDFCAWVVKWAKRILTLGISSYFEAPDADKTSGEQDVNEDTRAHARLRARRSPKPGLNPDLAAAMSPQLNKSLTIGKMDVVVNAAELGGDPGKAGSKVATTATDELAAAFHSLGGGAGAY